MTRTVSELTSAGRSIATCGAGAAVVRLAPVLWVLCLALAMLGAPGATLAGAQSVHLQMRPHVGDTVRLRFDQRTDLQAQRLVDGDARTMSLVTDVTVFTTAVVLRARSRSATVSAATDSAVVAMDPDPDGREAATLERQLAGQRILLELEPNGKTRIVQSGGMPAPELSALFARMPALLPAGPVPVGDSWTHTVPIPVAGQGGITATGMLRTTFRLDSISNTGDLAFISMRGTLIRSPVAASDPGSGGGGGVGGGVSVESSGTMIGRLTLDRRRGWFREVHVDVAMESIFSPAVGSLASAITVTTRSVQVLRQLSGEGGW